jgi:hypothetical protein
MAQSFPTFLQRAPGILLGRRRFHTLQGYGALLNLIPAIIIGCQVPWATLWKDTPRLYFQWAVRTDDDWYSHRGTGVVEGRFKVVFYASDANMIS